MDMNYSQIMSPPSPFASKNGGSWPPAPMGAPPLEIVDRAEMFSTLNGSIDRLVQCPSIGVSDMRSRYPKDPVLLYIMLI